MNEDTLYYFKALLQKRRKIDSLEQQLLSILVYRAESDLSSTKENEPGVITTKFYLSPFDGAVDQGYAQIQELIKLQAFDSFAQKYNLSLVDSRNIEGSCDRYYEISWNYQKTINVPNNKGSKIYSYSS